MQGSVQQLFHHYGYFGVFFVFVAEMVGAPFPAETTLTFCGVEWAQGNFAFVPLWLAAALGNMVGSTISYAVGHYLGYPVVIRYGRFVGLKEARLKKAEEMFAKHRNSIVLYGKFVSGVRVLTPFLAGVNRMTFGWFSFWNGLSALGWSAFFILEGKYLEKLWKHYDVFLKHHEIALILAAGTVVSIVWVLFTRKRWAAKRSK
ncbi:DedA family protein [Alicyclobacillus ferrooxydans]|uniref:VTT domain-containing protein n=1 Tax=Alicyclobacillus ferrooxydans TaxID=471514 RepID=A0A0P9CW27_9BACL|nr:DedA family protein [Alicyclobacillus ferrooxydans]KPV40862.1 hypothetical protein AN477_21470 [Alicyclobacillus ferrooxydans]